MSTFTKYPDNPAKRSQFSAGTLSLPRWQQGLLAGCAAPTQRLIETHYGLSPKLEAVDLGGRVMVVGSRQCQRHFAGRPLIKGVAPAHLIMRKHAANSGIRHLLTCCRTALSRLEYRQHWACCDRRNVSANGLKLDLSVTICYTETMAGRIGFHARLMISARPCLTAIMKLRLPQTGQVWTTQFSPLNGRWLMPLMTWSRY